MHSEVTDLDVSYGSCVPAADIRLPAKTAVIAGGFLNWRPIRPAGGWERFEI